MSLSSKWHFEIWDLKTNYWNASESFKNIFLPELFVARQMFYSFTLKLKITPKNANKGILRVHSQKYDKNIKLHILVEQTDRNSFFIQKLQKAYPIKR